MDNTWAAPYRNELNVHVANEKLDQPLRPYSLFSVFALNCINMQGYGVPVYYKSPIL